MRVALAALREALARVARVVPARATLPVLQCVRLTEAEDGSALTLDATNLDAFVRTTFPLDAGPQLVNAQPLRVALPAAALTAALQHANADEVTLTLVGSAIVELKIGRGHYKLAGLSADEMPVPPGVDDAARLHAPDAARANRLPVGALQRALRRVQHAASTEPSRPLLNAVHLERLADDPAALRLVAFNGHRLAEVRLPTAEDTLDAFGPVGTVALVPTAGLAALGHAFAPDELVAVGRAGNMLSVRSDRTTLVMRLLDGEFPPWRAHLRAASAITVEVERVALLGALERVAFAADSAAVGKESVRAVGLAFTDADGGACRVWAASSVSSAVDTIPCVVPAGAELALGVSAAGLTDALGKQYTGARVQLAFDTPRTPIHLTDPEDADAFAILSPLASPPAPPSEPTEDPSHA